MTQCMMEMSELVMVDKLQPEHITEDFCTQHSISCHSADHCKELLQQWSSRQEVVCIKNELDDAVSDVKIVPVVNPFFIKVNGFNGALIVKEEIQIIDRNGSMEEIDIKEEPLQDDLMTSVSKDTNATGNSSLKVHMNENISVPGMHKILDVAQRPLSCIEFGDNATQSNSLKCNVNCNHKYLQPFKSTRCNYAANKLCSLKSHIDTAHKLLHPFKCTECSYAAGQLGHLKRHINTVHKRWHPFKCTECSYAAGQLTHLNQHLNTVHKQLHPFKCTECSYAAGQLGHLNQHLNTVHKLLRPFKCTECSYAAGRLTHLNQHINTVHKLMTPLKCTECSYVAGKFSSLNTHVNTVHKRLPPFKCTGSSFAAGH